MLISLNIVLPEAGKDDYTRARARIWTDYVTTRVIPAFHRLLQFQPSEHEDGERRLDELRGEFRAHLLEFAREMDPEGPFFFGSGLGLVDIVMVPWAVSLLLLSLCSIHFHTITSLPPKRATYIHVPIYRFASGCSKNLRAAYASQIRGMAAMTRRRGIAGEGGSMQYRVSTVLRRRQAIMSTTYPSTSVTPMM